VEREDKNSKETANLAPLAVGRGSYLALQGKTQCEGAMVDCVKNPEMRASGSSLARPTDTKKKRKREKGKTAS
jgi:hypothetical protein